MLGVRNDDGDAVDIVDLKNELRFYLRISRYSKVIKFVASCQNYFETEYGIQRQIRNRDSTKLAVAVHQCLVISCCCLEKDANKF